MWGGALKMTKCATVSSPPPIISFEALVLGGGRDTLTKMELRHFYYVTLKDKVGWWLNEMYPIIYLVHS